MIKMLDFCRVLLMSLLVVLFCLPVCHAMDKAELKNEMISALKSDDMKKMNELLAADKKQCIKIVDSEQLLWEVLDERYNYDFIKLFVDNGAEPDEIDFNKVTPLRRIATDDRLKNDARIEGIVMSLIDHGADVNYVSSLNTPFYYGLVSGNPRIAKSMILAGGDVKSKMRDGFPIYFAVCGQSPEIVSLMLEKGAKLKGLHTTYYFGQKEATLLHIAAQEAAPDMVEFLIQKGLDVNAPDSSKKTPLHYANTVKKAELFVSRGANMEAVDDQNGWTPLFYAVNADNRELAVYLLERGADKNAKDRYGNLPVSNILDDFDRPGALLRYLFYGKKVELQFDGEDKKNIEKNKIPIERIIQFPLHMAAAYGEADLAADMLKRGIDVNMKDDIGNTPVFYTVDKNKEHAGLLKMLVEKGALLTIVNNSGETFAHWAAKNGGNETIKYIMSQNVDLKARDNEGRTAALAALEADNEAAYDLLTNGEDKLPEKDAAYLVERLKYDREISDFAVLYTGNSGKRYLVVKKFLDNLQRAGQAGKAYYSSMEFDKAGTYQKIRELGGNLMSQYSEIKKLSSGKSAAGALKSAGARVESAIAGYSKAKIRDLSDSDISYYNDLIYVSNSVSEELKKAKK